jgi:hypothetical protein
MRPAHQLIRIAYASADVRLHPMAHLMADIFNRYDRARFEVAAISVGADDASATDKTLQAAVDCFIDARADRRRHRATDGPRPVGKLCNVCRSARRGATRHGFVIVVRQSARLMGMLMPHWAAIPPRAPRHRQ